jgi:hypothetical protein
MFADANILCLTRSSELLGQVSQVKTVFGFDGSSNEVNTHNSKKNTTWLDSVMNSFTARKLKSAKADLPDCPEKSPLLLGELLVKVGKSMEPIVESTDISNEVNSRWYARLAYALYSA